METSTYQPTLFDPLPPMVSITSWQWETLDQRYHRWLAANPHILDLFISLSLQLLRAGRKHYGGKGICERIRWEYAIAANGDEWKINNSYISRLTRSAIERCPELADLFETRELRS